MAGSNRTRLTFRGIDGVHFGYGRMFVSLRDELADLVELVDNAETCVDVVLPNMVKGWWSGQRRVLFTMFETDELPSEFTDHLGQYDLILVPCNQNKIVFSKYHPNVQVVPLGTDTDFWCPTTRPDNETIRFLAGGSHWTRKGLDVVVQAWEELEPEGCELLLKCQTGKMIGKPVFSSSTIRLVDGTLTAEEERDLYWSADCFIAASRGEGWGLMPLQAICAGIPTLITDTTGHKEFSHLASRLITTTPAPASDPRFYNIGDWDDPDVESIKSAIQWFIKNRKSAKTKALANSKKAREVYTWKAAAEALLEVVVPNDKTVPTKTWVPAVGDLVQVTAIRRVQADVGTTHVDLRKGETALIPATVRDVLVTAGLVSN
jgi:glycosyltransferase involved in cell wall biosynthesis